MIVIRNITLAIRIATSIRQNSTQRQAIVRSAFKLRSQCLEHELNETREPSNTGHSLADGSFGKKEFNLRCARLLHPVQFHVVHELQTHLYSRV